MQIKTTRYQFLPFKIGTRSKILLHNGAGKSNQSQSWWAYKNGNCWRTSWKYVSKDFKMLIAAVFIIAEIFKAMFLFFNRRMVGS